MPGVCKDFTSYVLMSNFAFRYKKQYIPGSEIFTDTPTHALVSTFTGTGFICFI